MQIIPVKNIDQGIEKIKEKLYKQVDGKTVLFLSGGKTPKPLYEVLAREKIIKPAAVAMIDERYGEPMHENSNERMMQNTGLLDYFQSRDIPFYSILDQTSSGVKLLHPPGVNVNSIADSYDQIVRKLFFHFPKSIGILGIGKDGHTAGLPANAKSEIRNTKQDSIYTTNDFVTSYSDISGKYGDRITLTFSALSLLDYLFVFVFGKDKKWALKEALKPGSLEEIPARFYQKPEIAKKTIVITDQQVL